MKKIIYIFLFLAFQISESQELVKIKDSISFELKTAKKKSREFSIHSSKRLKGKKLRRIVIKSNIIAIYKQEIDINAFSLLDTENKLRYRIKEYIGYKSETTSLGNSSYKASFPYTKEKIETKFFYENSHDLPKYDPTIKDSFENFKFIGYENLELKTDFYTISNENIVSIFSKDKNMTTVVYYSPTQMLEFSANMHFTVIVSDKTPKFELYYGNEFVTAIDIKKL